MAPESEASNAAAELVASQQQAAMAAAAAATVSAAATANSQSKPPSRTGACRVCLKSFKPDDYSKTCFECQQRVCEDCASYSKLDESEDAVSKSHSDGAIQFRFPSFLISTISFVCPTGKLALQCLSPEDGVSRMPGSRLHRLHVGRAHNGGSCTPPLGR